MKGFSLIEYLLVMAIFAILAGLITINLVNTHHRVSLDTSVNTLLADLHEQQLKAMTGDTEGRMTTDPYGIVFGTNSYTLFHGTYSPSASDNFTVSLGQQIQFGTVTFPSSQIIFLKGSGEISGFSNGQNTITVEDTTDSNQKTITINRYGVVTGIK